MHPSIRRPVNSWRITSMKRMITCRSRRMMQWIPGDQSKNCNILMLFFLVLPMLSTSTTGLNIDLSLSKKNRLWKFIKMNLKTHFEKLKREKNGGHYGEQKRRGDSLANKVGKIGEKRAIKGRTRVDPWGGGSGFTLTGALDSIFSVGEPKNASERTPFQSLT